MSAMEITLKMLTESILPYVGYIAEIEDEEITVIDGGEYKRMSERVKNLEEGE